MLALRLLLAFAATAAVTSGGFKSKQLGGGMTCSRGALASGGDIHRANLTIAAATKWCEAQPGCAGFTSNTNGTKGVCTAGGDAVLDIRFKDQQGGNTDPVWTTWKRPGYTAVYFHCSAPTVCSLCEPPNATCAEVNYLAGDCFGECNNTLPEAAAEPGE